jgi:hypothetical protein
MATGNISLTITLTYSAASINAASPGVVSNTLTSGADSVTTTFVAYERNVQTVTTSKTPLNVSLISNIGYVVFHNADSTNVVYIYGASTSTLPFLQLNPGEWQALRFSPYAFAPQVESSAGTPLLEYFAIDN